jgi:hypothetical protein
VGLKASKVKVIAKPLGMRPPEGYQCTPMDAFEKMIETMIKKS